MTESLWVRRSWSGQIGEFADPEPIVVPLGGDWTLKKLLLHDAYLTGFANYPAGGNFPPVVFLRYTVNWFPAGGDSKEIFRSRFRCPSQFTVYQPPGASTPGWYVTYGGGDHELGFNQKYSYPQYDDLGEGRVELDMRVQRPGLQGTGLDCWWEGTFAVLGQRP